MNKPKILEENKIPDEQNIFKKNLKKSSEKQFTNQTLQRNYNLEI